MALESGNNHIARLVEIVRRDPGSYEAEKMRGEMKSYEGGQAIMKPMIQWAGDDKQRWLCLGTGVVAVTALAAYLYRRQD